MNDYKIEDVNDLIENKVVHCLMYSITWNIQKKISDEFLPIIRTTISQFIQTNNLKLYKIKVDKDQVFMIVQLDPDTIPEQAVKTMQNLTETTLKEKFPEIEEPSIWGDDLWMETTDKYSMKDYKNDRTS